MADPVVHLTGGIPDSGTGNVTTLGQLATAAGTPSSLAVTIQNSSIPFTVALSSNPTITSITSGTVVVSSIAGGTITSLTSGTVVISSGTLTSLSSGTIAIGNAGTIAAVKAANTAPSSQDTALTVTISPNGINPNGIALSSNSAPVVIASDWVYNKGYYVAVAASQTQAKLTSGSCGAIGDYLSGITVFPGVLSVGTVTLFDSTATTVATYGGGSTSLEAFFIPIMAVSRSSGWYVTTGTSVSILAMGRFSS